MIFPFGNKAVGRQVGTAGAVAESSPLTRKYETERERQLPGTAMAC